MRQTLADLGWGPGSGDIRSRVYVPRLPSGGQDFCVVLRASPRASMGTQIRAR